MNRIVFAPLFLALPFLISAIPLKNDMTAAMNVANSFYDGYVKVVMSNGDRKAYVQASPFVTPAFKNAYEEFLKKGGSQDPIVCGRDVSKSGLSWVSSGTAGRDIVVTRFRVIGEDKALKPLEVFVKFSSGQWRIDGTDDLHNKVTKDR